MTFLEGANEEEVKAKFDMGEYTCENEDSDDAELVLQSIEKVKSPDEDETQDKK